MVANPIKWPLVEKHLIRWLRESLGIPVYTETPADLENKLPALQVTRTGGGDGTDFTKTIQVEVETIAANRGQLWDKVSEVEAAMFQLTANGTKDWYVDNVTETFSAAAIPDGNRGLRRATATYGLEVRPHSTKKG